MRMQLIIRFDYGSIIPWVRSTADGIRAVAGPDTLVFHSGVDLHNENFRTEAEFTVAPGQRVPFVLVWHRSHEAAPASIDAEEIVEHTEQWWREWSDRCIYRGPYREMGGRSPIPPKALPCAPPGGIVAAATTSLPEQLGGVRNWDYRYCWLRDATFTLSALMLAGLGDEAKAWRGGVVRGAGAPSRQRAILYW